MKSTKIGFLGGTFDPIHFGHLNFALEALEKRHLDQIWFCPTPLSPHKKGSPPIDIKHRAKMVSLAVEGEPRFKKIDTEEHSVQAPYTLDTLHTLKEEYPNKEFTLLLSEDLLQNFHTWRGAEQIVEEFEIFIGIRPGFKSVEIDKLEWFMVNKVKKNLHPIRQLEISSSDIRYRLKNNLYCAHLLPLKVLDYISQHGLY